MPKRLIFSFVLALFVGAVFGNTPCKVELPVHMRQFDQQQMDDYKSDKNFTYATETPPNKFWKGLLEWLTEKLKKIFTRASEERIFSTLTVVFKILLWVLVAFSVFMILRSLFKDGMQNILGKKEKTIPIEYEEIGEDIKEANWSALADKAIQNKQYKTAVRFMLLSILHLLDKYHLIQWKKDKTNRDYHREIKNRDIQNLFRELSRNFDYVWYGDFILDKNKFEKMDLIYNKLNQVIKEDVEKI